MNKNLIIRSTETDSNIKKLRPWRHCGSCPRYAARKCPLDGVPDELGPRIMAYADFIFRVHRAREILSDTRLFYVTWKHILLKSVPEDDLEDCLRFIARGAPKRQ